GNQAPADRPAGQGCYPAAPAHPGPSLLATKIGFIFRAFVGIEMRIVIILSTDREISRYLKAPGSRSFSYLLIRLITVLTRLLPGLFLPAEIHPALSRH